MGSLMSKKSFLIFFLWRCPNDLLTLVSSSTIAWSCSRHCDVLRTSSFKMKNLFHVYWECCQLIALSSQSPSRINRPWLKNPSKSDWAAHIQCLNNARVIKAWPSLYQVEKLWRVPQDISLSFQRLGSQFSVNPVPFFLQVLIPRALS